MNIFFFFFNFFYRPPYIQTIPIDPLLKINYISTGPTGLLRKSNTCLNSSAVYVTCPDLLCGTRILSASQLLKEVHITIRKYGTKNVVKSRGIKTNFIPFVKIFGLIRYFL